MLTTVDRILYIQAVIEGQIGAEHVSSSELHKMHHLLADREIDDLMYENSDRQDVLVFDYDYQIFVKDYLN